MEREDGPGFFQLQLAGNGAGRIVEFGMSDAAWTGDEFSLIVQSLHSAGFSPRVERTAGCARCSTSCVCRLTPPGRGLLSQLSASSG